MAGPFQFFDTAAKDRMLFNTYEAQPDTMMVGASFSGANGGWNSYQGGIQYIVFSHVAVGQYDIAFQNIYSSGNETFAESLAAFGALALGLECSITYATPVIPAPGILNVAIGSFGIGLCYSVAGVLADIPADAMVHVQFLLTRSGRPRLTAGGGYG